MALIHQGQPVPPGLDDAPEPQIITPVRRGPDGWDWSAQLRPPYVDGTWQEPWSKAVVPVRLVALAVLWLTWHWIRFAAFLVLVALVVALVLSA